MFVDRKGNMRTREKSYQDYGMDEKEVRYIKEFCRNANTEQKQIIKYALSEIQPYIAPYVYYSLVENMSYEELCGRDYIYIGKGDFYGHRRQGMECIKRWLILNNMWEL